MGNAASVAILFFQGQMKVPYGVCVRMRACMCGGGGRGMAVSIDLINYTIITINVFGTVDGLFRYKCVASHNSLELYNLNTVFIYMYYNSFKMM